MYIDTHCHLNSPEYEEDLDDIVNRAQDADTVIIDIATTIQSSKRSLELAERFENISATAGFHPEEVQPMSDYSKLLSKDNARLVISELDHILEKNKNIVAVGESGLDYYWLRKSGNLSDAEISECIERQQDMFEKQVELAEKYTLPIVIHTRALPEEQGRIISDALKILNGYSSVKGIFHSFTGNMEQAESFLEKGHYISFNGILTFKKADDIRELFKFVYVNYHHQFFFETDGPYLAPEGKRGMRNEPVWVRDVYEFGKVLVGADLSEMVMQNITSVFSRCFTSI